jgi:hypothetical protein
VTGRGDGEGAGHWRKRSRRRPPKGDCVDRGSGCDVPPGLSRLSVDAHREEERDADNQEGEAVLHDT